ncbi:MAG: tRNA (guanosine(46)-N7)-methyltransferase TrmB [Candidatus Latescibacterota bacterium]|nr:MAG: tRNA (guanosine(46)-N7)-methyltransferase TrmB [Candidatus Latescibacterota bacterium]
MNQDPMTSESKRVDTLLRYDPRSFPPFADVFGNDHPVEIEIGCGKGKFLIARAMQYPDVNFLGIDLVWKWMRYAVERSQKRSLTNVKFIKTDAREMVRYGAQSATVSVFHIYFPDPWPKRRHHKRRLITGAFLRELHERLAPGGLIELATDHIDYFRQMQAAVVHSGISWSRITERLNNRLFEAEAETNYELKYSAAGRTLHYLELCK